jgi:four helix bundle protein
METVEENEMNQEQMKVRTKEFAKQVIALCRQLPATQEGRLIRGQFFRSGTSVGANYRAACRARSRPDFISKIGIALEETDESLYWMEILSENKIMNSKLLAALMKESKELIAIFVSSLNTAKNKQ